MEKAETARNTPRQSARPNGISWRSQKLNIRAAAPIASTVSVKRRMRRDSSTASRTESAGSPSRRSSASRRLVPRRSIWRTMLAPTVKLRPPPCISTRITPSPNPFQWSAVSTVTSPVTQVAETAVKRASTGGVAAPSTVATGSASRRDPVAIRRPKAIRNRWAWTRALGTCRGRAAGRSRITRLVPAPAPARIRSARRDRIRDDRRFTGPRRGARRRRRCRGRNRRRATRHQIGAPRRGRGQ